MWDEGGGRISSSGGRTAGAYAGLRERSSKSGVCGPSCICGAEGTWQQEWCLWARMHISGSLFRDSHSLFSVVRSMYLGQHLAAQQQPDQKPTPMQKPNHKLIHPTNQTPTPPSPPHLSQQGLHHVSFSESVAQECRVDEVWVCSRGGRV